MAKVEKHCSGCSKWKTKDPISPTVKLGYNEFHVSFNIVFFIIMKIYVVRSHLRPKFTNIFGRYKSEIAIS